MEQNGVRTLPAAPGSAFLPGCRAYGRGISGGLLMVRTVPSLISRWRGLLAVLCRVGLNHKLWAVASGAWRRGFRKSDPRAERAK